MIWAKSDPKESLYEHTCKLAKNLDILKNSYSNFIKYPIIWDLLYYCVWYHDAGKIHTPFQNKIKKFIGEQNVAKTSITEIPHNLLSPLFVPFDEINLDVETKKILIQAIAYHHERDFYFDEALISEIYEGDIKDKLDLVEEHLKMKVARDQRISRIIKFMNPSFRIKSTENKYTYELYILVKGLLHRLDHAASSGVDVEIDVDHDLAKMTENYLRDLTNEKQKNDESLLRPLQRFALENQDKNIIVVAQTGMGKTEAALLWAGKKKTFFTLPIRVSLNSIFDRVYDRMDFKGVGLLHSSSASYLQEKNNNDFVEDWEVIYDHSKQLSNKLLFTTIDQILKFPAKYLGYEKFYATMAYSAVIIDEIQAYDPKIVAFLIKALEMIDAIGGRFMIMTATLPPIYLETMRSRGHINFDSVAINTFIDDNNVRHRIKIHNENIDESLNMIVERSKSKKVLVIVNTVKKARELYDKIKNSDTYIRLLHSAFIQKHRSILESDLKDFNEQRDLSGIWITTQLVEASVDVDFDELYTEVATLDSLFQRFGRCYRHRQLDNEDSNIHIYISNPSDNGAIYDQALVQKGISYLLSFDQQILLESNKLEMVNRLYSYENLKDTEYFKEFQQAFHEIDNWLDYMYSSDEAQKLLRSIQNELVIPGELYENEVFGLIVKLSEEEDKKRRMELRREIEKYTLSIPSKLARHNTRPIEIKRKNKSGKEFPILPYIKVINLKYDFDEENRMGYGLKPDEKSNHFL